MTGCLGQCRCLKATTDVEGGGGGGGTSRKFSVWIVCFKYLIWLFVIQNIKIKKFKTSPENTYIFTSASNFDDW